jgi:hypothetical protein
MYNMSIKHHQTKIRTITDRLINEDLKPGVKERLEAQLENEYAILAEKYGITIN